MINKPIYVLAREFNNTFHDSFDKFMSKPSRELAQCNPGACTNMYTQVASFMRPTWDPSGADRTQVGPMLVPWTLLLGQSRIYYVMLIWSVWRQGLMTVDVGALIKIGSREQGKRLYFFMKPYLDDIGSWPSMKQKQRSVPRSDWWAPVPAGYLLVFCIHVTS